MVRRAAIFFMLIAACGFAQVMVDERRIAFARSAFGEAPPPQTLRCSISPIPPQLNYGFRFQAGYSIDIPMNQFEGTGHRWRMITRIVPKESGRPVYLVSGHLLPSIPRTKVQAQVGGVYLLGEGIYQVRHVLIDEQSRTCSRDWKVDVHLGRGDSKVRVAMAPGTVLDLTLRGARQPIAQDDARPMRLTILLHTAPLFSRRTRLRQGDIMTLLASVSAILEHVPTTNVRLVAFNLDQQKEIYRKDGFAMNDLPEVAGSMNRTELGLVDVNTLQNRRGHIETIAGLLNAELTAESPSDAVIVLGPMSRFADKVPAEALENASGRPQFLFFHLAPTFSAFRGGRGGSAPMTAPEGALPDSIRHAVSKVGGKTMTIRSPGELAKAIDRLEQAAPVRPEAYLPAQRGKDTGKAQPKEN